MKRKLIPIASLAVLIIIAIAALCMGRYSISAGESMKILFGNIFGAEQTWSDMQNTLIFGVRLPRILASVIVGAGLSAAGAVYQSIFQNPLVSPDLLGVSSGACVGAATAILLGFSYAGTELLAFAGGIIAVAITLLLPKLIRRKTNVVLVLSGIVVSGLMTSALGTIKYCADPDSELAAITYWQMGSFSGIDNEALYYTVIPISIICLAVLWAMSWQIDILALGEKEARDLGVNVSRKRLVAIICSTLLTACSVSLCGTVGWVGLVIPHIGRMLSGQSNTVLLPASMCMGGLFMLIIDTIARTAIAAEIPISILTGAIGAPFYAWVLFAQRDKL